MDVRCKESRAAVPKGRLRPKRPGLAWAAGLLMVALAAIVALGATSARAANGYEWEADTPTSGNYEHILGKPEDGGRYAGRVWTDKSVVHEEGSDVFKTTFSALGSSRVVNSEIQNPLDVVFVVDVSGSMNMDGDSSSYTGANTRMASAVDALNTVVGKLMGDNPNNRVAVATFSGNNNTSVMLDLGRYNRNNSLINDSNNKAFSYQRNGQSGTLSFNGSVQGGGSANKEVTVSGGTNTQYGLRVGMNVLVNADSTTVEVDGRTLQRIPAVVLLSDGAPTYSMVSTGYRNQGNWWSDTTQVGNGGVYDDYYYGNGILAMMQASYQKQLINDHYGVKSGDPASAQVITVRTGSFAEGSDALLLADVTLDPKKYYSAGSNSDSSNTMATNIWSAWSAYARGGSVSNVPVGGSRVTIAHPTSNDINSLVYNDSAYTAGPDNLTDIFTDIIQRLQSTASSPVRDEIGDTDTELTYTDPLGRFMEVSGDEMTLSLFGQDYVATRQQDGSWLLPDVEIDRGIYGEKLKLRDNVKIGLTRASDGEVEGAYQETLTVKVSADMLPVRLETVDLNADGTVKNYTPATNVRPLTLTYNVGFSKAIIDEDSGAVDLSKVPAGYKNAHGDGKGGVSFYSNDYNFAQTPDDGETVGMATASFAPARNNRFYYFQQNRIIYSEGKAGDPTTAPGDDGVIGSASKPVTDRNSLVNNPDKDFYLIIDYYSPHSDQMVKLVVARTGAELLGSVDMVDGCVQTVPGTPRLGNTDHFTLKKNTKEGQDNNKSGTASLAFAPTFNYDPGLATEYVVDIALGNNGRVTVPETAVRIQKDVPAVDGIVVPSQEFSFTVTVEDGRTRTDTLPVYERQGDGWIQKETQDVVWVDGKATVKLKAGQSVLVEMAPGVAWSAVEKDPSSVEGKQTGFAFEKVDGPVGATVDGANRSIAGTSVENTVQDVTFSNVYTPEPVSLSIPASKVLVGRDWTADDAFTLKIEPVDGAPMADKDGKPIASEVTVNKDKQSAEFGKISFDKVGKYTYKVTEVNGGLGGITYDSTVYTVTVEVTHDAENRRLTATTPFTFTKGEGESAEPVDGIVFTNTYSVQPATTPVTSQVKVSKELSGRKLGEGEFEFKLYDSEGNELATGKNAADGTVTFDRDLTFSAAGEYTYTVREVKGNLGGVTYDETVYSIVLTVTDNGDGTLSVSRKEGTPESVTFNNTYKAAEVTDTVAVAKTLGGRDMAEGEFTFQLLDKGGNAVAETTNGADGKATLGPITFNEAGTYTYTVSEVKGDEPGVTYDGRTYDVTFTVTDDGNGKLVVTHVVQGTEDNVAAFSNTYVPAPVEKSVTEQVAVTKTLAGRDLRDGEFGFELVDGEGKVVATGTNDADGKVTMEAVEYTKTGTYEYTLREVVPDNGLDNVGYDRTEYKVTVTVTDEGGQLAAAYVVDGADPVTFKNTYTPDPIHSSVTENVTVTKTLTGRDLRDGEFEFELVDSKGDVVATGKNDASGKVTMGAVEYTQAGTYEYTLREANNGIPGMSYDPKTYKVTVKVTADTTTGELSATSTFDAESVVFSNTYNADAVSDYVAITKTLDGRQLQEGEFTFQVTDGAGTVVATATNGADGKATLGPINFDKAGTYTYTVSEVEPAENKLAGVTYDGRAYDVTFTVTDDGNGKLAVTHEVKGTEDNVAAFKNTFTPESIGYSVTSSVDVTKMLTGRDLRAGEFGFELVDGEGNVKATGTNDADGKVTMDAVEYTKPGEYKYTLREAVPDDDKVLPGVSYDEKTYDLTVTVKADDVTGALSAEAVVAGGPAVFTNTYTPAPVTSSVTDTIGVTKSLTGRDLKAGEFSFELVDGEGKVVATGTNDVDGKVVLDSLTYDKAGTYTYTLREAQGSLDRVDYDTATYTVVVTVTDDGSGKLVAAHAVEGSSDTSVAFKNTFTPEPIGYSVTSSVDVTKVLDGRELKEDDKFTFELVDGEGRVVATGTNDASGKVTMDDVEYTRPGEYKYTLREADNGLAGVTYDKATYDVTVTVKADDVTGALSAEAVVAGGPAVFTNTYNADAASTTLSVSKQLTGRGFLEGETFSFTLAARGGAPMPAAGGETATVSENLQQAAFGAITFTTPGEYRYTISEVGGGSTKDGVAYDGSTFTATVKVRDNALTGRLEVDSVTYTNDATGAAASIPSFINRYTSTGSMDGVASVNVYKVLTGRPMAAGQFAFSVTPADDASSAKLPAQTLANQASDTSGTPAAVVTAEGKTLSELFSGVTFTEADAGKTFSWTVAETSEGAPGYTVDQHKHTVEVEVADNGNGTITATTYVNGDAVTGSHALIAFENGYHAESNPDAAEGSGRVTTTKTLHNRDLAGGEFTFQMRDAKGTVVATVPNAADGTVDFGAVKYTSEQALADVASGVAAQVGTADKPVYRYTYTLSEVTDALPENVSAEVPTVTVTVDVADNGDGTMTCSVVWPSDGAPTGFVNAYEADPLPVTISGTKVFTAPEGLSVPESVYGAFTFTLTDEDGNVLGTATNDRSGSVAFPEITYTQDDLAGGTECTFTYTVTETGSVPGITNDAAPTRTVTVHLSQGKDGHLSTRVEGMPFTFTNTYSVEAITTSATDQVKVTKSLTGRSLADGEFEFRLVDESGEVAASGTNAADGTVTMSPVTYTEPGVHTYTLGEVAGDKPGVGYDDAVYTVTTTVVDNGDGTLSATHKVTGGEAVFNNTFTPTPVVDPAFGVAAKKVLVGRDWTEDDAFTFVTVAETENAPMPDPATVVATKASPMGTFGAVVFSEPGTYSYLVSETAGDEEHMTYSQALYRVVYEVAKDEATGELSMSTSVTRIKSDDGADVDEACPADAPMEFVNTYSKPAEPVVPEEPQKPADKLPEPVKAVVLPVTGLIAKTGDVVAPLLPWIGVGAAAVTAGALRILKGGRRRKD